MTKEQLLAAKERATLYSKQCEQECVLLEDELQDAEDACRDAYKTLDTIQRDLDRLEEK